RTFSYGRELRRLKMRERELRRRAPLPREIAKLLNEAENTAPHDLQRFVHLNDVGVVGDERRRRAEVNDSLRARSLNPVRINVRHHVMTDLALATLGLVVVDLVHMRGELR